MANARPSPDRVGTAGSSPGTTVLDPDRRGAAVLEVGHARGAAERQRLARRHVRVRVEAGPGRGAPPCEARGVAGSLAPLRGGHSAGGGLARLLLAGRAIPRLARRGRRHASQAAPSTAQAGRVVTLCIGPLKRSVGYDAAPRLRFGRAPQVPDRSRLGRSPARPRLQPDRRLPRRSPPGDPSPPAGTRTAAARRCARRAWMGCRKRISAECSRIRERRDARVLPRMDAPSPIDPPLAAEGSARRQERPGGGDAP